jgi:hypothetical protein
MPKDERALTRAVRERMEHTGETYAAARDAILAERGSGTRRYVLAPDVEAYMRGEIWCRTCYEHGDARAEDTSLQLVVAAYDPDLSPTTMMISSQRHHAPCAPSKISWARNVDVPRGPYGVSLPAEAKPEVEGEYAVTVRPHLIVFDPSEPPEPALLIHVEVTEDHGEGAGPWLSQLEVSVLRPAGFADISAVESIEGWSVRAVDGHSSMSPQWIAVRVEEVTEGRLPDHLYLGALELPQPWLEASADRGELLVLVGPCAINGEVPTIPDRIAPYEIDELLESGALLAGYVPFVLDQLGGVTR